MKKIFILFCFLLCEFGYSQEMQQIFRRIDKDISYDPTSIDETLKQILSIDSQITFNMYREEKEDNNIHLRFHQFLNGYRIEDSDLLVHVKDNKIAIINGSYYSSVEPPIKSSSLSESEILQIAENEVFSSILDYDFQYKIEKIISKNIFESEDKSFYYAYKISVFNEKNLETSVDIIIDEQSGKILWKQSGIILSDASGLNTTETIVSLSQNAPNPFNSETRIEMYVPITTTNAILYLHDLQGKLIKAINIIGRGTTFETIYGSGLQNGMYVYNLVIDGKIVGSKQMIIKE